MCFNLNSDPRNIYIFLIKREVNIDLLLDDLRYIYILI